MTTTQSTDVAELLAARKSELAHPPQTEYSEGNPVSSEYIPPAADAVTGEIVPVSTANGAPPVGAEPRPPAAAPAAVEPARQVDYSMIPAKVLGGIPYAPEYARLAKTICNTEMVPMAFRGAWDKVMAAFMRGYELGLGPMQSLDSFNVIEGKVGLGAEAMRALIIEAGHQIILEEVYGGEDGTTVTAIDAACRRSDWAPDMWRTYSFSMQDALLAGLLATPRSGRAGAWQKYPRAMLEARATSGAGRRYFPDVLAGMSYTPEEIRDFDGPQEAQTQEAPPSDATAAALSTAPSPAPAADPPPSPSPSPSSSPPAASVPAASSDAAPAPAAPADSTDSASATSSPASTGTAPPTATKPKGRTSKKAAPSPAAPSAPAPEASTAPTAEPAAATGSRSSPEKAEPAGTPTADGQGAPLPEPGEGPGEAGVLQAMRSGLATLIQGLPAIQQPLCRAFLLEHFPDGAAEIRVEEDLQKAIDIAAGWPESADDFPPPVHTPGQQSF